MGKIWGMKAGGLRKDNVFFYYSPAQEDSIINLGTTAKAVSARPQVGYIVVHFMFPFVNNSRL